MSGGWIKLHRRLRDHWLWSDPEQLRAWLELLLRATYRDERKVLVNGQLLAVPRGSVALSKVEFARELGWSRAKLERYIKRLVDERMAVQQTIHKLTLISLVNFEAYQDERAETIHKTSSRRDSRRAADDTADDTPIYKKEREEGKRRKERNPIREGEQPQVSFPDSLDRPDVRTALTEWTAYRDSIGRPFPAASLAQNLRIFDGRPKELITAIHRSIARGYVALLPAAAVTLGAAPVEEEEEPEWIKFVEKAKQQKAKLQ